ncbi:unnamed protein product [Medioppia subpectinata]|uniref:Rab-GAP TBC domain-containing protein n=1 Tax=Medioppia subpectinata TaxID=1979941 RepID=A0A7R9KTM0_9ACAR|nr:unnamed protein product [Medioppia subpectinata]CAG2108442.1 unnamed protein product [Medioppia subpectinata]
MSHTSSPGLKSVITRLDSSPVRRRRVMAPTPLVYAMAAAKVGRQSSAEDDYEKTSIAASSVITTSTVHSYRQPVPQLRSPTKSHHSASRRISGGANSGSSISGGTNSTRHHRRDSGDGNKAGNNYHTINGEMTAASDNTSVSMTNTTNPTMSLSSSNSSVTIGATTATAQPKITAEDQTSPEKQCNRFGFFVDSSKTDVVPELKKQDIDLIRKREKKWIQMLDKWDKYMNNRWKTVRDRCRKGIPHSMRGQAWLYLCGGHHQIRLHPNAYRDLCAQEGNEQIVDEIRKDIHRQFPNHELFAQPLGTGQTDLLNVLKAFSILKPDIGYCQGQAPIASVLLMHMPAEQAFWSLVAICDHYLPGYFSPGLEAIQLHGDMLFAFLKRFAPNPHRLMDKQKIEPILFMTEWFMCVFARTLPWTSVLRVWDMFLCEGIKIVFKCAIVLVSVTLKSDTKKTCPSMYETLEKLRHLSVYHMSEPLMVESILRCELHDQDLQREHNIQEKKRRQKAVQKASTSPKSAMAKTNGKRK